jgi:hypothetical protein
MRERFASNPELKVISAAVVRLDAWDQKHLSNDYF